MNALWAIARSTFRQAVRDRLLYGILFFAVAMLFFGLVLGELSLHEERRVVVDVGLAGISLFTVIAATIAGVNLLYKELDRKTLFTVLSKPIARWQFLLGKFAGLAVTILLALGLMGLVLVFILSFKDMAIPAAMPYALVLIAVEAVVVTAVAVFFSSFASPFMSGIFTFGLFVIGRNGDVLAELASRKTGGFAGTVLSLLVDLTPNLYLFYPSGEMFEDRYVSLHRGFVPLDYLGYSVAYGLAYAACLVILAVLIFRRKDVV
ncbi:MAG: ABC transporter permease subunit [Deltaproteobacteria bacterium]|nr:ABC transporter permease subunit [Deltaproteobacteria bacterium]